MFKKEHHKIHNIRLAQ